MEKTRIAYVVATAFFCLAIAPSAIGNIVQPEMVVEIMTNIGMPMYLLTLLGVWKLFGIAALAAPRFRRINEWAYAGFFFDLTGASYVHAAGGDTLSSAIVPLVFLVPLGVSYALRSPAPATATPTAATPALAA